MRLGKSDVEVIRLGLAQSPEQVRHNVTLAASPPPADLWAELLAEGLLRPDAPVPTPIS